MVRANYLLVGVLRSIWFSTKTDMKYMGRANNFLVDVTVGPTKIGYDAYGSCRSFLIGWCQ